MYHRKEALETGEVYHVMTKSIAGYEVFASVADRMRMALTIQYYKPENPKMKLSRFMKLSKVHNISIYDYALDSGANLVEIIAYCVMPTHLHLILKQMKDNGISMFMGKVLNSYSRYLNTKRDRKGPLWEGRFKNVLVDSNEQLLHLTRYIHLNPVTAGLIEIPDQWEASSFREYVAQITSKERFCNYDDLLEIDPADYRNFVMSRIDYQKELAVLKKAILE